MKFITASSGQLVELEQWQRSTAAGGRISTGIEGLDGLFGPAGLLRGRVYELLYPPRGSSPLLLAVWLAKAAIWPADSAPPAGIEGLKSPYLAGFSIGAEPQTAPRPEPTGVVVVCDPQKRFYPPAAAQLGIPLSHLYLLQPQNRQQMLWSLSECLASAGVCAAIADLGKLTQVEARRLQLASERGQAIGILTRPAGAASSIYAASTRILVTPMPTESAKIQRWQLELLHGQADPKSQRLILEYNREEHTLRAASQLANREGAEKGRRSAAG